MERAGVCWVAHLDVESTVKAEGACGLWLVMSLEASVLHQQPSPREGGPPPVPALHIRASATSPCPSLCTGFSARPLGKPQPHPAQCWEEEEWAGGGAAVG